MLRGLFRSLETHQTGRDVAHPVCDDVNVWRIVELDVLHPFWSASVRLRLRIFQDSMAQLERVLNESSMRMPTGGGE